MSYSRLNSLNVHNGPTVLEHSDCLEQELLRMYGCFLVQVLADIWSLFAVPVYVPYTESRYELISQYRLFSNTPVEFKIH